MVGKPGRCAKRGAEDRCTAGCYFARGSEQQAKSGAGCAVYLRGPEQEVNKPVAFPHQEAEEHAAIDLVCVHTGVGLDPPADIFTLPWLQTVAPGCVPQEPDACKHDRRLPFGSSGVRQTGCPVFQERRSHPGALPAASHLRIMQWPRWRCLPAEDLSAG